MRQSGAIPNLQAPNDTLPKDWWWWWCRQQKKKKKKNKKKAPPFRSTHKRETKECSGLVGGIAVRMEGGKWKGERKRMSTTTIIRKTSDSARDKSISGNGSRIALSLPACLPSPIRQWLNYQIALLLQHHHHLSCRLNNRNGKEGGREKIQKKGCWDKGKDKNKD